jgi:ABC-type lipoprotein release transport system permease subunit
VRIVPLWTLIRRDLVRARGALVTSGFGIAAGTAALVFFLALGLGVRSVLLGEVFPIDQVELEPPKGSGGLQLFGSLLGAEMEAPGISDAEIERLRAHPAVAGVYPKLRFAFPAAAGGEIFGRKVGTPEMIGDGIEPALVAGVETGEHRFEDPMNRPGKACTVRADGNDPSCSGEQYCEGAIGQKGVCLEPVPVVVSRYLVELYDKSFAPAHGMPQIGETILGQAQGLVFWMFVGKTNMGRARQGEPRTVRARVVGVSPRAIDIGITVPVEVVRRWNRMYASDGAAENYSSVVVKVTEKDRVSEVIAFGETMSLSPKDTRARDVSVLLTGVMALLALVAGIILLVSASNIAYTFRVLVADRRREIALYRAIGASAGDMIQWLIALALTVGVLGGAVGAFFAWLMSLGADWLAATRLPDFPFKPKTFFEFPGWLLAGALGFAALFALLGAVGPARRAGKVDPAAALAVV